MSTRIYFRHDGQARSVVAANSPLCEENEGNKPKYDDTQKMISPSLQRNTCGVHAGVEPCVVYLYPQFYPRGKTIHF